MGKRSAAALEGAAGAVAGLLTGLVVAVVGVLLAHGVHPLLGLGVGALLLAALVAASVGARSVLLGWLAGSACLAAVAIGFPLYAFVVGFDSLTF